MAQKERHRLETYFNYFDHVQHFKTYPPYTQNSVFLLFFIDTEGETLRCTGVFLHCSAVRLSKDAKDVFISYGEVGK